MSLVLDHWGLNFTLFFNNPTISEKLTIQKLDALVFDLDGTLINSNNVWDEVLPEVFKEIGITYQYTEDNHYNPMGLRVLLAIAIREFNITPEMLFVYPFLCLACFLFCSVA